MCPRDDDLLTVATDSVHFQPLIGASFYERNGLPYCKNCFEANFAAKCAGCAKSITEKAVIALDVKWHRECFRCKDCRKPIAGNTFAVEDNMPLCTKCAGIEE